MFSSSSYVLPHSATEVVTGLDMLQAELDNLENAETKELLAPLDSTTSSVRWEIDSLGYAPGERPCVSIPVGSTVSSVRGARYTTKPFLTETKKDALYGLLTGALVGGMAVGVFFTLCL